jgi:transposase
MSNTKPPKLAFVRKPTESIRLEPGEANDVGVDVQKASYSFALVGDRRGLIATWVQPARPEVFIDRLRPVREGVARLVYEAGPTGFVLASCLRAKGFDARVIVPSKLPAPVCPEAKSDRLDWRRLAQDVRVRARLGPGRRTVPFPAVQRRHLLLRARPEFGREPTMQ